MSEDVGGLNNEMKREDGPNELENKKEESPETNLEDEKREKNKNVNESRQAESMDERAETAVSKDRHVELTVREVKEDMNRRYDVNRKRECESCA